MNAKIPVFVIYFEAIIYVAVIVRCRVQYGKYFSSFSYFATYYAFRRVKEQQYMRNEENICQYCTRQRVITTLSLNACLNKMYQELSYLLIASGLLNII